MRELEVSEDRVSSVLMREDLHHVLHRTGYHRMAGGTNHGPVGNHLSIEDRVREVLDSG